MKPVLVKNMAEVVAGAVAVADAAMAVGVVEVAVVAADAVSSRAVKGFFNRLRRFHGGAGQNRKASRHIGIVSQGRGL